MKDVKELKSERVAIYPPGEIPLLKIIMGSYGGRLAQTFSFNSIEPSNEAVEFKGGFIVIAETEIIIPALKIDDRRIVVTIEGAAEQADLVAERVGEIVFEGKESPECLHVTPATSCTAHMSFTWEAVYNSRFVSFLREVMMPEIKTAGEVPELSMALGRFDFRYRTAEDLVENAITVNPKSFVFGPEPRRPISEQRYVAQSPTRSEDHLRLLEELERLMSTTPET